ncbi:MAG: flippase-like domain-containing protein [Actinobacteria bacterium]|nr:flippase-like domain-containing protein [Actinomycetota bacterium]
MDGVAVEKRIVIPRFVKLAISAGLIALIAYRIDWAEYADLVESSTPSFLSGAFVVAVLAIVLSAYKWRLLVVSLGMEAPFRFLVSSYFVGLFFNNFMPSNIGGDVVRVMQLAGRTRNGPASTASVVAERVIAASSLGAIALLALALNYTAVRRFALLIVAFGVVCIAVTAFCLAGRQLERIVSRFPSKLAAKLEEFFRALAGTLDDRTTLWRVLVLSIAFHAMVVLMNVLIFKAMGLSVPLARCLAFIPVISALSMLPVSINGLGIREISYVYFFGQAGVSTTQAVAASLYFYIMVTLTSLIGGIIFALKRRV